MPSQLERAIATFRAQVLAREATATGRLIAAYQPARERLVARIDALVKALEDRPLTPTELKQWDRALALFAQIDQELTRLGADANAIIMAQQERMAAMAGEHAKALALASVQSPETIASIDTEWNQLKTGDVEALVGRMSDGSPLNQTLSQFGADASKTIAAVLQQAVATSMNPRATARVLAQSIDAEQWRLLRIARTEALQSYRASSRLSYIQNSDVLSGTRWICAKQTRTCAACLAMDQTEHPVDYVMEAHPNCRCILIPIVKGEPDRRIESGERWFAKQPEDVQRSILGVAAYGLFQDGALTLADFAQREVDPRWGGTWRKASIAEAYANARRRQRAA